MQARPSTRGFTLIELLVVLAVIAGAAAMVVPALNSITGANARQAAGKLAGTTRVLFDAAALRHATCRLAIDIDKRAVSAECAPGPAGAPAGADDDDALAIRFPDESDPEIRKILARSTFGQFKDRLVDRFELPGKSGFGPIRLEGKRDAQESGTVYVYFFPGGQAQKAWIPVVDGNNLFTVVTEPFTGRTRVVAGKVEVKE